MPDPEAHAINQMLDHLNMMDRQLKEMCQAMKAHGIKARELEIPELTECEIRSAASDDEEPEEPLKMTAHGH